MRRSRWGAWVAGAYLGLALLAGALAVRRLVVSTAMPGLAAWELLVLALPWTLLLEAPAGRQAGMALLAAITLGGVGVNAGLLYVIGSVLERRWRRARGA